MAEKEMRNTPRSKYVKFDVWAEDTEDRIHNTEVQKSNKFDNLPVEKIAEYTGLTIEEIEAL